jgi:hypothetical protein
MDEGSTQAIRDVVRERFRQIAELGYTYEHDDRHNMDGELVVASFHYAAEASLRHLLDCNGYCLSDLHRVAFDPQDSRTNIVRAAALLIAEVERRDRLQAKGDPRKGV